MRRSLVLLRTFCLVAGAVLFVFYGFTVAYVIAHRHGTPDFVAADCGIVFGSAVHAVFDEDGGIVSSFAGPGIRRRVETAAELFGQGRLRRVFLTGGKGEGNQMSEAEVMRDVAIAKGIPAGRITVEDRSRSTWENLLYTRPLTSTCESVVAISDGYHLARIGFQARLQGWDLQTYRAGKQPTLSFTLRNWLREAAGIDLLVLTSLSR